MNAESMRTLFTMETRRGRILNQLIYPVIITGIVLVLNLFTANQLLTGSNLALLIANSVSNTFIAWGVSYIWSTGPDFSCAASMILGANVGGILVMEYGLGYFGLFGGAIATCVILQLISTTVRLKLNLPPWVIGIGMCLMYESFGIMYATSSAERGETTVTLGSTTCRGIAEMPWIFILLFVGLIAMVLIYSRTIFGGD